MIQFQFAGGPRVAKQRQDISSEKPKPPRSNSKPNERSEHTMAPNNPNQKQPKPTIILPHYHKAILTSLGGAIQPEPVYVHPGGKQKSQNGKDRKKKDNASGPPKETYQTNITGNFTCANPSCKQSWASGKVAIVIPRFSVQGTTGEGMGYNATIYNQRCRACKQLGVLRVDREVYVERVAYRLKMWTGVQVDRPPYDAEKKTPPHEKELCEGCKRGVCLAASDSGGGGGGSLPHRSRPRFRM